jgi:predicted nucleic acid-binding protein
MSGSRLLLDTNAVLQVLSSPNAISGLAGKVIFVSFITELELYSYPALSDHDLKSIDFFMTKARILDITKDIKGKTIALRKKHKLKLPDAIICATAMSNDLPLVTGDKRLTKIGDITILSLDAL